MSAALPPLPRPEKLFENADHIVVGYYADTMQSYAQQARADLEAENTRLREALTAAADDIESWGAYASYFFQQKHDLQGAIDKARTALKEQP